INDILDFSKIEAGKLELEVVEFVLATAVEDAVELVVEAAHRKGLELACFIDPRLPERALGDPDRLRQILINLVGNAVKFTERGVDSEPGPGSTFWFPVRLTRAAGEPRHSAGFHGRVALIVDHNATSRQALAATLAGWGLDVETAAAGRQALELIRGARRPVD